MKDINDKNNKKIIIKNQNNICKGEDHCVKAILVGGPGTNKSELMYSLNSIDREIQLTIGCSYVSKTLYLKDLGKSITFDFWNTAGRDRFRSLAQLYCKDAGVIILVYDITSKDSFDEMQNYWYEEAKKYGPKEAIFCSRRK